jgi:hypothetical protein
MMNEQRDTRIAADERCCVCGSADLTFVGVDEGGYWGGMRCNELRCNGCDAHFAVGCDEIMPDGSLLHDPPRLD